MSTSYQELDSDLCAWLLGLNHCLAPDSVKQEQSPGWLPMKHLFGPSVMVARVNLFSSPRLGNALLAARLNLLSSHKLAPGKCLGSICCQALNCPHCQPWA